MFDSMLTWLFGFLAIAEVGLPAVFIVSFVSATLIPMGSEPVVFAVIKANPTLFWGVILVATMGNTLGGVLNYAMAFGAHKVFAKEKQSRWFAWLEKYGAKTMLLAWLPIIGDPICAVGGWLKLPFWPCVLYMAIGKFVRYVVLTFALMTVPNSFWHKLFSLFG